MTTMRVFLVAVAVAALAALLGTGLSKQDAVTSTAADLPVTQRLDQQAPALAGATLEGGDFDLAGLRGQVVVVNVMAAWCGPCRQEVPVLADVARQWAPDGVAVVGVSMRDDPGQTRRLLDDSGADFPVIPDPEGTRSIAWGVRGVPETFVVDRSGRLRLHALGPISADWLRRELPALLST